MVDESHNVEQEKELDEQWPVYGYDENRTGNAKSNTLPQPPLEPVWRFGASDSFLAPPVVGHGSVFTATADGTVYRIDADTGEEQWKRSLEGWVRASPALGEDTLFVGCGDSRLYALDCASGETRWDKETGAGIGTAPLLVDDQIIGANRSGKVFSFERSTGSFRWGCEITSGISVPLAATRSTVYAMSDNGVLYSIDLEEGDKNWQTDPLERSEPIVRPTDGKVIVPSGWEVTSPPARAGPNREVTADSGAVDGYQVYFSTASRDGRWKVQTGSGKPAIVNDTLITTGAGTVRGFDIKTGLLQYEVSLDTTEVTSPVIVSGHIYVGGENGVLYAVGGN